MTPERLEAIRKEYKRDDGEIWAGSVVGELLAALAAREQRVNLLRSVADTALDQRDKAEQRVTAMEAALPTRERLHSLEVALIAIDTPEREWFRALLVDIKAALRPRAKESND